MTDVVELKASLKAFEKWWNQAFDWEQGLSKDLPTEHDLEMMRIAFINGFDIARTPEAQWISVEDRLPELHRDVIVIQGKIRAIGYVADAYGNWDIYDPHINSPTHWMPLPQKPTKG